MGHNHWVLDGIAAALRRHSGGKVQLRKFVQSVTVAVRKGYIVTALPRRH